MSPHDINVLMHHYANRDTWPQGDTPAYRQSLAWAFTNGLIDRQDGMAVTTKRGNALVAMLCGTPLPEQVFINPLNGMVVEERT